MPLHAGEAKGCVMTLRILIIVFCCDFLIFPAFAGTYCTELVVPQFYETKPELPIKPYCLYELSNTNTCEDYIVTMYNLKVNDYNIKIDQYNSAANRYISELNDYIKSAKEYAQCEADHL